MNAPSPTGGGSYYINVISGPEPPLGNLETRAVGDAAPVVLGVEVIRGEVTLSLGWANTEGSVKTGHVALSVGETTRLAIRLLSCLADADPATYDAVVRMVSGVDPARV